MKMKTMIMTWTLMMMAAAGQTDISPSVTEAMNSFTGNLLDEIMEDEDLGDEESVVVSPFGLHTALTMLTFGSPDSSDTCRQLAQALGYGADMEKEDIASQYALLTADISDSPMNMTNYMFLDRGLDVKCKFRKTLREDFDAEVMRLDFAGSSSEARRVINGMIMNDTGISEFLPEGAIDRGTQLVLTNAIRFQDSWLHNFTMMSDPMTFHPRVQGDTIQVQQMRLAANLKLVTYNDVKVLEVPYENSDYALWIVLPPPNDDEVLGHVVAALGTDLDVGGLIKRANVRAVDLRMPPFEVEFSTKMKEVLRRMNVTDAFKESRADFTDITDDVSLSVSDVIHKAVIKVDEKGTEASAASAIVLYSRSRPRHVLVDRPFGFVIYNKALKIPLFVGRVMRPDEIAN